MATADFLDNTPSVLASQPFKAVWALSALAFNLARFPWLLAYYALPWTRPHPKWTLGQAVRVSIIRTFLWNASLVRVRTPENLQPGREKDRFVVISPAADRYYTGAARCDDNITPRNMGCTWYPKHPPKNAIGSLGQVVLHFHGGAYAIGDGRTADAGFAAKTLIGNTDVSYMFAPQYRLASNPSSQFPAQLQDAITSYKHLVEDWGVKPSQVILSGDSAGGNLVLALMRYIADHGQQLGLEAPRCAWLWSPWISPATAGRPPLHNPNAVSDYVNSTFGAWGALSYAPDAKTGKTLDDPYITFLDHPFATKVPMFASYGECEILIFEGKKWAEQMEAVKGNKLSLSIEPSAPHDTILIGDKLGFKKEAVDSAKKAADFSRALG